MLSQRAAAAESLGFGAAATGNDSFGRYDSSGDVWRGAPTTGMSPAMNPIPSSGSFSWMDLNLSQPLSQPAQPSVHILHTHHETPELIPQQSTGMPPSAPPLPPPSAASLSTTAQSFDAQSALMQASKRFTAIAPPPPPRLLHTKHGQPQQPPLGRARALRQHVHRRTMRGRPPPPCARAAPACCGLNSRGALDVMAASVAASAASPRAALQAVAAASVRAPTALLVQAWRAAAFKWRTGW